MYKIAIIKDDKKFLIGPDIKMIYVLLYPIFNNCDIAIIEDEEIKVILTYDEFLDSEV